MSKSQNHRTIILAQGAQDPAEQCNWAIATGTVLAQTTRDALRIAQAREASLVLIAPNSVRAINDQPAGELAALCKRLPVIAVDHDHDRDQQLSLLSKGVHEICERLETETDAAFASKLAQAVQRAKTRFKAQRRLLRMSGRLRRGPRALVKRLRLLKHRNRRLQHYRQLAEQCVANIAHDFRTPLAVISDYASIVRDGIVGSVNDQQKKMMEKVNTRAADLNQMANELLDISRMNAGMMCVCRRKVSIPDIVSRQGTMLIDRARAAGIRFEVSVAENLPRVYCDPDLIGRVIVNLAVNAIKATPQGSSVRLWATPSHDHGQVTIGVSDNGPGIAQPELDRIFERFQKIADAASDQKGYGLGLAIAQKHCELNLSSLQVESSVGLGSTFRFDLPVAKPKPVIAKWLHQIRNYRGPIGMIDVKLPSPTNRRTSDDFDRFLHRSLHKRDLLLRTSQDHWVLLLAWPTRPFESWETSASEGLDEFNRSRCGDAVTEFRSRLAHAWPCCDVGRPRDQASILNWFDRQIAHGPQTPAVPAPKGAKSITTPSADAHVSTEV